MIERVAATIDRHRMLPSDRKVGVAVSGGADSVFLLHALYELGFAGAVLHVNHQLRGAESDADEAFVRDLAAEYNLPLNCSVLPVPEGNVEQEARRLRYAFFAQHSDIVATGHNLDDQAETVLYRFLRGAGTAGLSGILPVTACGAIVRPLIEMRRDEIRHWLRDHKIRWREDLSNANSDFLRNRIRHQHLPELTGSLNPSLPEVLASTSAWARAEEDYWSGELDRLEPQYLIAGPDFVLIQTGPFFTLPVAVQRRMLRRGIERVRGSLRSIDFRHIEATRALMEKREGSGRIQLPGLDVYRSFDWLRLAPIGFDTRIERDFELPLQIPGITIDAARGITIEVELTNSSNALPVYNTEVDGLDWERCAGSLFLRNWRPGDQYQSRGRSRAEKIKTLFQEFRVPLWERRRWPVIVSAGAHSERILWTRKFGVANDFAARPESRNTLMIREGKESNPVRSASMELKRARRHCES